MPSKHDKTEAPTPKRRRETREKGQIARSQDLTAWMSVLLGLYVVPLTLVRIAHMADGALEEIAATSTATLSPGDAASMLGSTLLAGLVAIAPLVAVGFVSSFTASFAQTGPLIAIKALKPDFKKISPKAGFQRLFSMRSLWETGKQLLKLAVIIGAAWPRASGLVDGMVGPSRPSFDVAVRHAGVETLAVVRIVAWAMLLLSVADYGYQRYRHGQDMRMTRQEVRDEVKNAEGDAHVKGRIRSAQRALARNRMIADVGSADVVITNPTHLAVALRYDMERGGAPRVVATGAGNVAARIRAAGTEHDVPIVEAKPLARALWRSCDVGDEVPIALYEAVAKVLVFVRRLDRRFARSERIDLPRESQVDEALLDAVPAKRARRGRAAAA